ncbi:MAG: leucine-rich repeat domain-containing protein, partial [Clostridia bacterium]|nr:leucine-rich repeat domain-containing protein [Clostridia bacterium]
NILQSGDFRYILLADGSAAIITAETEGELVIPAELDGHPVTSLGLDGHPDTYLVYKAAGLLDENRTVVRGVVSGNCTGITLPDSLTAIGSCAFTDCADLKTVQLPDSLVSIGSSAFLRSGLESVSVPEGVTRLKAAAFRQCANLRSVTLPAALTAIEDYTFEQCSALTEISIPEGVKTIGSRALAGCGSLRNVVLPDSLEDMKEDTFAESFNILCTVSSASYGSRYCQYFGIPLKLPGENAPVSGLLKNGPFRYVVLEDDTAAIISAEADGALVFPSMLDGHPVSAIGLENSASLYKLYEEAGLRKENYEYCCIIGQECTSAVIPEGVTLIGNSVFQGCDRLVSVSLPSTLKMIGTAAFQGCSSLEAISLPDGLTTMMEYAFYGCKALSSVQIPESVTAVGDYAFSYSGLVYALLPDTVTAIGNRTFYSCEQLQFITLPKRLETIGEYAFSGCEALSALLLPDSVTAIGSNAFSRSGLTSVALPESLTDLPENAFQNCEKLSSVTLPSGLTSIGNWAFSFCPALETLSIPETVTHIGRSAFSASSRLTCVVPTDSAALSYCRFNSIRYSIDPASYGIVRSGNYQYILLEDNTAAILTAEAEGELIIPAELDGHPVTAVGLDDTNKTEELYKAAGLKQDQGVVSGCTGVTIPDSVTVIG